MAALKGTGVNNPRMGFLELPVTWVWSISLIRCPTKGSIGCIWERKQIKSTQHSPTQAGHEALLSGEGRKVSERPSCLGRACEVGKAPQKERDDVCIGRAPITFFCTSFPPVPCEPYHRNHEATFSKESSVTKASREDYIQGTLIPHCKAAVRVMSRLCNMQGF